MSSIKIEFEIDNDAFHEDLPAEVRRILIRDVCGNLSRLADEGELLLRDINGNTIGKAEVL